MDFEIDAAAAALRAEREVKKEEENKHEKKESRKVEKGLAAAFGETYITHKSLKPP